MIAKTVPSPEALESGSTLAILRHLYASTMKTFPPVELNSQRIARWVACWCGVVCALTLPASADAQHLKVRTQTVARATQFLRTDQRIAAQRPLSQTVDVWGYDLTGQKNGTLRGHASLRYFNDFALSSAARANPYLAHDDNRLTIDLANVTWRPLDAISVSGGRLLTRTIFFARDLDGLRLDLDFPIAELAWLSSIYAGRHVEGRPDTFHPDQYDVQGRPIEERFADDFDDAWLLGFRTGVRFAGQTMNVGWERRGTPSTVGEERVAVTATGNPLATLNTTGYLSYHTLLQDIDRGRFLVAWRAHDHLALSGGYEHVVPTFDSASIFNLFGTSPSQSTFLTAQTLFGGQTLIARTWFRTVQGDGSNIDFGTSDRDAQTIGFGLEHRTPIALYETSLMLHTSLSFQPSGSNGYGGDQGIGRVRASLPIYDRTVVLNTRSSVVFAGPDATTRREGGAAFTQLLGVDTHASFGTFSVAAVGQTSDVLGSHLNLYASFVTELWP